MKEEDYSINTGEDRMFQIPNMPQFISLNSDDFRAFNELSTSIMPPLTNIDNSNILSLQVQDETTMDVATKFQVAEFLPYWPRGPPERCPFPGQFNFQVEISAIDTHKRKYLYSHQLNRIYVDMRVSFPVSFHWDVSVSVPCPMFVRAIVVFSDESQAEKRVERCTQHTHDNNADTNLTITKNVLHSSREKNTHGVYYCGQPELADSWYSVLVEFPTGPGTHAFEFGCKNSCPNGINRRAIDIIFNLEDSTYLVLVGFPTGPGTHAFEFGCKNSCPNGINRRAIDIIFNLEDSTGLVYGRQIVGARVCACPRRDMHKDQETEGVRPGKKRVASNVGPTVHGTPEHAQKKKIKIESVHTDDEILPLPQLNIIGSRAMTTGLEVMLRMMEQAAGFKKQDPLATAQYNRSITALKAHIDKLKARSNVCL